MILSLSAHMTDANNGREKRKSEAKGVEQMITKTLIRNHRYLNSDMPQPNP